jgi:hypothetical protein
VSPAGSQALPLASAPSSGYSSPGLGHSFTWSYLTFVGAGHFFPGVYAIVWVVARIALYNWAFASAITVIMLAAAGLVALRLLRTLFGNRPAILVLLVVYLVCPLTMLDLRWWSTAIESLPLQIAVFMALDAQVHYVRTGRFRHAIAAAAWSVQDLQSTTSGLMTRLYIANAQAAVAEAPAGTVIADSQVPSAIMLGAFGQYADASRVIGPMEGSAAAAKIRWTTRPDGTIDHLMMFGTDGRLHQAAIYGQTSAPPATGRQCQPVTRGRVVARFPMPSALGSSVLRIAYLAAPAAGGANMIIDYGGSAQRLAIMPGLHAGYLPLRGSAGSVTITSPAIRGLCVGDVQAGIIVPSPTGPVIPAAY